MLVSGPLVWHTSYAAFTASTSNSGNTFSSGNVQLSDNDSGSALFTATALKLGSSDAPCIDVIYTGTLPSTVKLSAASTALAPHLDFAIEEIGTSDNCASPTGTRTAIDMADTNLATKVTALTAPGIAIGWSPSTTQTKRYRFSYTLQDNNAGQNKTASVGFTWTATSS